MTRNDGFRILAIMATGLIAFTTPLTTVVNREFMLLMLAHRMPEIDRVGGYSFWSVLNPDIASRVETTAAFITIGLLIALAAFMGAVLVAIAGEARQKPPVEYVPRDYDPFASKNHGPHPLDAMVRKHRGTD